MNLYHLVFFSLVSGLVSRVFQIALVSFRWGLVTSSGEVASQVSVYPLTRWGLPNKPNHLQLTPHQFIFDNYFPSLYWIWLRFKTKRIMQVSTVYLNLTEKKETSHARPPSCLYRTHTKKSVWIYSWGDFVFSKPKLCWLDLLNRPDFTSILAPLQTSTCNSQIHMYLVC